MLCSAGKKTFRFELTAYINYVISAFPDKLAAVISSKTGLNKTIFARNCEVKKIEKTVAEKFLDEYHLMNSTSSAYNYGLYFKNELLAVASFSKGRKMNRLPEDKRSFELIRFCCREGITVTGGLTKLVKNFCREKNAGDIMTYVDKQFSSGESFAKAGFVRHSETEPKFFLVNKKTFERIPAESNADDFDPAKFYLVNNEGNIKFVYTPNDQL